MALKLPRKLFVICCSLIIISFCITNCREVDLKFIDTFTDLGQAQIEDLNSPVLYLDYPPNMIAVGDWIIVSRFKGDFVLCGYNLNNNQVVNFGRRGQGPKEIVNGYSLNTLNDTTFSVYCRSNGSISFFKVRHNTLVNDGPMKVKSFFRHIIPVRDSVFLTCGGLNFEKKYGLYNAITGELKLSIDYPGGLHNYMDNQQKSNVYNSFFSKHPDKPLYISVYEKHVILDFLQVRGDSLVLLTRQIMYHFPWKASKNLRPMPLNEDTPYRIFSRKIFTTDRYIYIYFEYSEKRNGKPFYWLLQFDWDGNKVGKINLTKKIYAMTHTGSNLYGIILDQELYKVVKIII